MQIFMSIKVPFNSIIFLINLCNLKQTLTFEQKADNGNE